MCYLKEFKIFVAAFEERSFSAAAKRENVTQPGVSQCIKKIERALGVDLFVRTARFVEPTPAGERYYKSSIEILKTQAEACSELKSFSAMDGEISVMAPTWLSSRILPRVIADFTQEFPQIRVAVVNTGEWGEVELARRGAFSVSFSVEPDRDDPNILVTSPLMLVHSSRSEFSKASTEQLVFGNDLRIVKPSDEYPIGRTISKALLEMNVSPQAKIEINSVLGILSLVENSNWCAFIPGFVLTAETIPVNIIRRPIPQAPIVGIRLDTGGGALSVAANAFILILRKQLSALESQPMLFGHEEPYGAALKRFDINQRHILQQ